MAGNNEDEVRLREIMQIAETMLVRTASPTATVTTEIEKDAVTRINTTSTAPSSGLIIPTMATTTATSLAARQLSIRDNFQSLFSPYARSTSGYNAQSATLSGTYGRPAWPRVQGARSGKPGKGACKGWRSQRKSKLELNDAGLGRKEVTFDNNGDAKHVSQKLEGIYPKLLGCGGFEVLRSQGARDVLRVISPPRSGHSVPFLRDLSCLRAALASIRPIQQDISMSKVAPVDPMPQSNDPFNITCLGCGIEIPIDRLREHHENYIRENSMESNISEDPDIEGGNCLDNNEFSKYDNHVKECLDPCQVDDFDTGSTADSADMGEKDRGSSYIPICSDDEVHATKQIHTSSSRDGVATMAVPDATESAEVSVEASAYKKNASESQVNENDITQLVDFTRLACKECETILTVVGPTKYIKVSEPEDSFSAAIAYFKGPEYEEQRPLSIQYGKAINAGGLKRKFFQDVLDGILSGNEMKLFEGCKSKFAPVSSSTTLMSNVLEVVGKIVSNSIVEGGPPFAHLASPIYRYLITGSMESYMQHANILDVISAGIKYVVERILQASSNEELHESLKESDIQIGLEESHWDKSIAVTIENKHMLVQWLLQYDVIIKREKAIQKFGKALEALGLLQSMRAHPEHFEQFFVWNGDVLTPDAVLELLEADIMEMDDSSKYVCDVLQEFVTDCD
eukprot:gene772-64_t